MMLVRGHSDSEGTFAEALERYLADTLHTPVSVEKGDRTPGLPAFIAYAYSFYEARIAARRCIVLTTGDRVSPADLAKHVDIVRSATDAIVIYAAESLNSHNRARLIQRGVAFAVPGNQLYIPELAMDLREHFRAPKAHHADALSPAAQAVIFHHLLGSGGVPTTPSAIAKRLHYTPMSIGRAFDELIARGLAQGERLGKERHIYFHMERRELFDAARSSLRTPVRSVKCLRESTPRPALKLSGESALSALSELTPPRIDTYAITSTDWNATLKAYKLTEVDREDADFYIETWSYDPAGLSDNTTVDAFSLYAAFHDDPNERISLASERLLEKIL